MTVCRVFSSVFRTSLLLPAIVSVISITACSQAQPEQTPASQTTAAAAPALTNATPAPGAERFSDDPHPERVDLSQVTKESLSKTGSKASLSS
jgi:hypothetical protein